MRAATPADVLLVAKASFDEGTAHAGGENREAYLRAVEKFQQAARLYRRGGDAEGEANALYSCARAYSAMDDSPAALDLYVKALPLIEAHGTPNQKAGILLNIGLVNLNIGENYAALENFELALGRFRQYEIKLGEARTLSELTERSLSPRRPPTGTQLRRTGSSELRRPHRRAAAAPHGNLHARTARSNQFRPR